MKMEKKYIRRRRVAFALSVVLASALVYGIWKVSGNLWWVGGEEGYCWGEMTECFFGKGN